MSKQPVYKQPVFKQPVYKRPVCKLLVVGWKIAKQQEGSILFQLATTKTTG